jgi:hypothetical protein
MDTLLTTNHGVGATRVWRPAVASLMATLAMA